MGFFNKDVVDAMFGGDYICSQCGAKMEFENEDSLVCSKCGHSLDYDRYGHEDDEDYDALYPSEEEFLGSDDEEDEDDCGETYDEVYGELDD